MSASELQGFCDSSAKAYGAVVFLRIVTTWSSYVRFVSSKTRVAPISEQNIPRLELLSAVALSRLILSIKKALSYEMKIYNSMCWTDKPSIGLFRAKRGGNRLCSTVLTR